RRLKSDFRSRACCFARTHSTRCKSTPAASADAGWKLSLTSTSAHTSCCCVSLDINASRAEVRPEEAGPQISLTAPLRTITPGKLLVIISTGGRVVTVSARGIRAASDDSISKRKAAAEMNGRADIRDLTGGQNARQKLVATTSWLSAGRPVTIRRRRRQ